MRPHSTSFPQLGLADHHLRQLDAHKGEAAGEADQDAGEADADEHHPVAARRGRVVGTVQQDEAEAAHSEEERRRQTLHDVLAVDAVRQERHLMQTRRLSVNQEWESGMWTACEQGDAFGENVLLVRCL